MNNKKIDYIGLYGNVAILKKWCEECKGNYFVVDGMLSCCGSHTDVEPEYYKRESQPEFKRRSLSNAEKNIALERQEYRCIYCERMFGSVIIKKGRIVRLRTEYDHYVPYSLTQNNKEVNYVASCHICNSIKSNLCFRTLEEAKVYIQQKWIDKGIF